MNKDNCCSSCAKICASIIDGNLLCTLNGVVNPNYSCKKFSFNCLNNWQNVDTSVNRKKCIECSYFNFSFATPSTGDGVINHTLGTCGMFLVREFDGAVKNSCSRINLKCS